MWFDRFAVVEAHYAFCMDYHGGMGCRLYARMCRIGRYFRPGPLWSGRDGFDENSAAIYDALVAKFNA